ncbi:APA family fibronectin-binding glycoprotein, partial [Mycobacterium sp.]|uniref:APA family fibronectin-binding glycoprotein n=1 Tax=Mycobacterium sp. TaxID=1785 RepID=UPI003F975852
PAGSSPNAGPPQRWFVVWLGTANDPVDKGAAKALAESIQPWTAPPAPPAPAAPPAPGAPAPPPPPPAPAPAPGQAPAGEVTPTPTTTPQRTLPA